MGLNNLQPANGAIRRKKRIGRGNASGQGRTAGRGNKGYQSRSGARLKVHYEGGQTPLMRRLPKRGFSNYWFKKDIQVVNLKQFANFDTVEITIDLLKEKGLIKNSVKSIKILANGDIDKALTVTANYFSQSAVKKIEAAGGKVIFA